LPKLYVASGDGNIAYLLEGSVIGRGTQLITSNRGKDSADYLAVIFGLNEYYFKWNKELDARHSDIDREKTLATGQEEFYKVSTPSDDTPRELPPPVLILVDNDAVVNQIHGQWTINNSDIVKLAKAVLQMSNNVKVEIAYIDRKENEAVKILP